MTGRVMNMCLLLSVLLALCAGPVILGSESRSANPKIIIENASFIAPIPERENMCSAHGEPDNQGFVSQGSANDTKDIWQILGPLAFINSSNISDYANIFASNGGIIRDNLNNCIDDLLNLDQKSEKEPEAQCGKVDKRTGGHYICG